MSRTLRQRWLLCALFWGLALAATLLLAGVRARTLLAREQVEALRQFDRYFDGNQRHISALLAKDQKNAQRVSSARIGLLAIKDDLMLRAAEQGLARIRIDAPQVAAGSSSAQLKLSCTGQTQGFLQLLAMVDADYPYLGIDTVLLENNQETGQSLFTVTATYRFEEG